MCSHCSKPLFGSASRGRLGKYYPAYHCNKRGHHFRVPKGDFDETVKKFIENVRVSPEYIESISQAVIAEWDRRQEEKISDGADIDVRIAELKSQAKLIADKIKFLNSEIAIKYVEEDLIKIEEQITELAAEKAKQVDNQPNIRKIMERVKHFLEHLDYLLVEQMNPVLKAACFGVIFNQVPSYHDLVSGTTNFANLTLINELFMMKIMLIWYPGLELNQRPKA